MDHAGDCLLKCSKSTKWTYTENYGIQVTQECEDAYMCSKNMPLASSYTMTHKYIPANDPPSIYTPKKEVVAYTYT